MEQMFERDGVHPLQPFMPLLLVLL